MLGGPARDREPLGDLAVGQSARHESEHLDLSFGETGRPARPGTAAQAACPQYGVHRVRVEAAGPDLAAQVVGRSCRRQRRTVRPALDHGPEGVGGREHPGRHREPARGHAPVVAAAVAALVVLAGEDGDLRQGGHPGEDELALVRVRAGLVALGPAQGSCLVPDPARDARATHVVQVPGQPDGADRVNQPEVADGTRCEPGDTGGVTVQVRTLQVDQVSERTCHRVGPVLVDPADRIGLGVEHALVRVDLVDPVEQPGGPAYEDLAEVGVELATGPTAHRRNRGFLAGMQGEQDRGRGHVHDAGAQRDRLARRPGVASAVPAGDGVEEARLHRLRESEPSGRIAGDLAGRRRRECAHPPSGLGSRCQDADAGPAGGLRQSRHPGAPDVRRCPEVGEEGQPDRRHVVAPDLRGLVRVRGAAEVLEERGVDDVADLAVGASRGARKTLRDDAPFEGLLQWRTGTHVGGDRQPPEQRQQAEHIATVPQPVARVAVATGAAWGARTCRRS
jgi:hypothetical protein